MTSIDGGKNVDISFQKDAKQEQKNSPLQPLREWEKKIFTIKKKFPPVVFWLFLKH